MQTILLIEDNNEFRENMAESLEFSNYKVLTAQNGKEGVEMAIKERPDLIICDIMMPVLDGHGALNLLSNNKITANIPFIFLTAKSKYDDFRKGMEMGADDYISKPVNMTELMNAVEARLKKAASASVVASRNDELEKLNQLKDRLFSIISHDLRSPLGNIRQLMMIAKQDELTKYDLEYYLTSLSEQVQNASTFLENLLLWTKSQMQGIHPKPRVLNMKLLTDDTLNLLRPTADKKEINLRNEIDMSVNSKADEEMIKFIMRNLISNAIKFCKAGDSISVSGTQKEGESKITIEDSGIGMDEETVSKLFTPAIASSIGTAGEAGTGLGLLLCKEFIVLQGGTILVTSIPGKGSKFIITLPNEN